MVAGCGGPPGDEAAAAPAAERFVWLSPTVAHAGACASAPAGSQLAQRPRALSAPSSPPSVCVAPAATAPARPRPHHCPTVSSGTTAICSPPPVDSGTTAGCSPLPARRRASSALTNASASGVVTFLISDESGASGVRSEASYVLAAASTPRSPGGGGSPPGGGVDGREESGRSISSGTPATRRMYTAELGEGVPLRGVGTAECVRLFSGGEARFRNSVPAPRLDAFLSHSWGGCWWQKCVAIAMYGHFACAFAAACAVGAIGAVAHTLLAEEPVCFSQGGLDHQAVVFCKAWPSPSYAAFAALFGWLLASTMTPGMPLRRALFLDKGCINQEDPVTLAKGVSSLGGILRRCSSLVVLWSGDYFQRLWCVFELACFAHFGGLGGAKDMLIFPLVLPTYVMLSNLSLLFVWVTFDALVLSGAYSEMSVTVGPFAACIVCHSAVSLMYTLFVVSVLRTLVQMRKDLADELASFAIERSRTTVSQDRERIEFCIRHWYGGIGAFERFVQERVLPDFQRQLGGASLVPYSTVVCSATVTLLRGFDYMAVGCMHGVLWTLSDALVLMPLCVLLAQTFLKVRSIPTRMATLFTWVEITMFWGTWNYMWAAAAPWVPYTVMVVLWPAVLCIYLPTLQEIRLLGFPVPTLSQLRNWRWCSDSEDSSGSDCLSGDEETSSGDTTDRSPPGCGNKKR